MSRIPSRSARWRTLLFACLFAVLASCGGGESPTAATQDPTQPEDTQPEGMGLGPNRVGPDGGSLEFFGGQLSLTFPVGAVSTVITITTHTTTDFPDDRWLVGGTVYRVGPEGTTFAEPVLLKVGYQVSALPVGVESAALKIYRVAGGAWSELEGSTADAATQRISASITSFSTFGILGPAKGSVAITSGPTVSRQGDVVSYTAEVRDEAGNLVDDPSFTWSVNPPSAGLITEDGQFVGYDVDSLQVVATASRVSDSVTTSITPRGLSGSFSVLGHREFLSQTSAHAHISVHGTFAYTGTVGQTGDGLLVWNISDPATPTLTDSVVAGSADNRVNDVMVRADGGIAAMTSNEGGILLLDLSDPAHPAVITRFTEGLEQLTHNLWIDGEHIYVTGRLGLVIVNMTNLQNPAVVASYNFGAIFRPHDVQVRDGVAVVSHWADGLIILDVGGGGAGGSPANAIELSRIGTPNGWTHNAWYWPATGYVFIGEESGNRMAPTVYVMDARELSSPKPVATYTIPGDDPHNFWLDEDRGILYVAWLRLGVRAIDVTGTLLGDLERQGRQIAGLAYDGGRTFSYSLQARDGLVYVSDIRSGLWVLQLQP